MKTLSNEALATLDTIRTKAETGDTRLNRDEFLALKYVYEQINVTFNNSKRTLREGCTGCIPDALRIVNNYLKHYPTPPPDEAQTGANVSRVIVKPNGSPTKYYQVETPTRPLLKDLRIKYPHIKSISVEGFLDKLKEEQNV